MARRAAETADTAQQFTFTLTYKGPTGPYPQAQKPKYNLKRTATTGPRKSVMAGDMVQFVPDPKLRHKTIMVRFRADANSDTPKSPFNVNTIRSASFHRVVTVPKDFYAWCYIVGANGTPTKVGGKHFCNGLPC